MPKLDGTGPNGKGPMTGRGSGYCVIPLDTTEQELEFLNNQAQALGRQLKHIKTRISKIKRTESKVSSKGVCR
jgi:hypothetical protein